MLLLEGVKDAGLLWMSIRGLHQARVLMKEYVEEEEKEDRVVEMLQHIPLEVQEKYHIRICIQDRVHIRFLALLPLFHDILLPRFLRNLASSNLDFRRFLFIFEQSYYYIPRDI